MTTAEPARPNYTLRNLSPAMLGVLEHLYARPRTSSRDFNAGSLRALIVRGLAHTVETFPDGTSLVSLTANGRTELRERIRRNGGEIPAVERETPPATAPEPYSLDYQCAQCGTICKDAPALQRHGTRQHGAAAESDGLTPAGVQLIIDADEDDRKCTRCGQRPCVAPSSCSTPALRIRAEYDQLPYALSHNDEDGGPALFRLDRLTSIIEAAEQARALEVAKARTQGASWTRIGQCLGVTKQAAQMRYGKKP